MVGRLPLRRRLAAANACSASGSPRTPRSASADLGLAASHNDVKSCHTVLPEGNRGEAVIGRHQPIAKSARRQNDIWSKH